MKEKTEKQKVKKQTEESGKVFAIDEAIKELRNQDKRKFMQTLDLIINLKNFDAKKENINTFIQIPNPCQKKVCAFLSKKTNIIETITKEDFKKFKETKDIKKLSKKYDFFIASAPLMSDIASKFGRVLGPRGKMPSPQIGIITSETDESIKSVVEKIKKQVRIMTKERSIKIPAGKEDMSDKELKENIESIIHSVENLLPKKRENIKNILIKFTMSKPLRIS
jgi:large subunit ribosomal protein L1